MNRSRWYCDHSFAAVARSAYGQQLDDWVVLPGLQQGESVDYDVSEYTAEGLFIFQWMQPDAHFRLFDSSKDELPSTRLVISGKRWRQAGQLGAVQVWSDTARDQAVWELPGR